MDKLACEERRGMLNPDNKLGVWPSVLCALRRKESDIITISLGVSEKYGGGGGISLSFQFAHHFFSPLTLFTLWDLLPFVNMFFFLLTFV